MSKLTILTLVAAGVLGWFTLRSTVVWLSTRLHEAYVTHQRATHEFHQSNLARLRAQGVRNPERHQTLATQTRFETTVHSWADRVTRRGTHRLSTRHKRIQAQRESMVAVRR